MIDTYSLGSQSWLAELYGIREQWIPAYTKQFFAVGMSTTQRSEGMNSFFDQFVNSCTGMKDFIKKSVEALDKQFFKERKEDFDTKYYSRKLIFKTPLEVHGAQIYTKNIFKRFQAEMMKSGHFTCEKFKDGCSEEVKSYSLRNRVKGNKDRRLYSVVHWRYLDLYKCSCQMFEHSGLICRHLLRYLDLTNVNEIPSSLTCQRWLRDANKHQGEVSESNASSQIDFESSQTMRFNHLSQVFAKLALEASVTKNGYKHALQVAQRETVTVSSFPPDDWSNEAPLDIHDEEYIDNKVDETLDQSPLDRVHEPNVVQTKGRKRQKRIKSSLEKAMTAKPLRKCKICGFATDHDSRNHFKVVKTPS